MGSKSEEKVWDAYRHCMMQDLDVHMVVQDPTREDAIRERRARRHMERILRNTILLESEADEAALVDVVEITTSRVDLLGYLGPVLFLRVKDTIERLEIPLEASSAHS